MQRKWFISKIESYLYYIPDTPLTLAVDPQPKKSILQCVREDEICGKRMNNQTPSSPRNGFNMPML